MTVFIEAIVMEKVDRRHDVLLPQYRDVQDASAARCKDCFRVRIISKDVRTRPSDKRLTGFEYCTKARRIRDAFAASNGIFFPHVAIGAANRSFLFVHREDSHQLSPDGYHYGFVECP